MTEGQTGLCPRCGAQLGAERGDVGLLCENCGGVFIRRDRVNAMAVEGLTGPMSYRQNARKSIAAPHKIDAAEEVRYLRCPKCAGVMNRQNFGRRSGIIVDVCPVDGTWFDGGEAEAAASYLQEHGPIDPKKMVPPMSRPTRVRGDLLLDLFS